MLFIAALYSFLDLAVIGGVLAGILGGLLRARRLMAFGSVAALVGLGVWGRVWSRAPSATSASRSATQAFMRLPDEAKVISSSGVDVYCNAFVTFKLPGTKSPQAWMNEIWLANRETGLLTGSEPVSLIGIDHRAEDPYPEKSLRFETVTGTYLFSHHVYF